MLELYKMKIESILIKKIMLKLYEKLIWKF